MVFNTRIEDIPETDSVPVSIANGKDTETYLCSFSACTVPTCTCEKLTLHFSSKPNQSDPAASPVYSIKINLRERIPEVEKTEQVSEETTAFAKRLFSQLDHRDFQYLNARYFDIKYEATINARPETIEASFDFEAIEQDGLMYSYMDILPYAPPFLEIVDNEPCLLLDQYCLAPNCGCTEASLVLVGKDRMSGRKIEHCTFRVDYVAKIWNMVENHSLMVPLGKLQAAMENQINPFYESLANRHTKLKLIHIHNLLHYFKASRKVSSESGRNEPCPCGSGKKYKKCCGRN